MSSSFSGSLYQQILDIYTVIVNQIIQTLKKKASASNVLCNYRVDKVFNNETIINHIYVIKHRENFMNYSHVV